MSHLSVSRFVELENEFLRKKEDRLDMVLSLLRGGGGGGVEEFQTVAGLRRVPSSSKYRRMARQAECKLPHHSSIPSGRDTGSQASDQREHLREESRMISEL